jgi:hypothetical protein
MIVKYLLLFFGILNGITGYELSKLSIARRNFIKSCICAPLVINSAFAEENIENKPLTEEEMKEYQKLLEEAKRIKSIIDANKNAAEDVLKSERFMPKIKEEK